QRVESLGAYGINCFAGAGGRWKTRMFAPGLGVAEDPATGSAAGPIAYHLVRHGRIGFGDEIEIVQGVEIDALHHGPNWESCGSELLHERVLAATEGDGWVADSTYHTMLGALVSDR